MTNTHSLKPNTPHPPDTSHHLFHINTTTILPELASSTESNNGNTIVVIEEAAIVSRKKVTVVWVCVCVSEWVRSLFPQLLSFFLGDEQLTTLALSLSLPQLQILEEVCNVGGVKWSEVCVFSAQTPS